MPTVTVNFLQEFCHLVRRGDIPHKAVKEFVEKYKNVTEPNELLSRILGSMRMAVEEITDSRIRAESYIKIAGLSEEEKDIEKAIDAITALGCESMRSEVLAIMVRTLAISGNLRRAWMFVHRIGQAYWRAEAILAIALRTDKQEDFDRARKCASHINNEALKNDCLADIDFSLHMKESRKVVHSRCESAEKLGSLSHLVHSLMDSSGHETAYKSVMDMKSAMWRFNLLAAIADKLKNN